MSKIMYIRELRRQPTVRDRLIGAAFFSLLGLFLVGFWTGVAILVAHLRGAL